MYDYPPRVDSLCERHDALSGRAACCVGSRLAMLMTYIYAGDFVTIDKALCLDAFNKYVY